MNLIKAEFNPNIVIQYYKRHMLVSSERMKDINITGCEKHPKKLERDIITSRIACIDD